MKKKHPGKLIVFLIGLILISASGFQYALADSGSIFTVPVGLTKIDEEAFYGIHADRVILPEGILRIEKNAFAYGVVKSIYLPASIQFIDDSAFEETWVKQMSADEGTYAYNWAVRNGYIKANPVSITVTSNAGDDNEGHYHDYGESHTIIGSITSLVKIKKVRAEVVYRGGEHDGESAFDCSQATVSSTEGLYSIDIRNSNLNKYIAFDHMPCGPLRMYFYADLVDGRTFTIYEYDFYIVEEKPVEINITSIAGDNQSSHIHEYGKTHNLEGNVKSSIPIRTLTASVVFQTEDQVEQIAYDCSAAKTDFSEDICFVDLSSTNLGQNLKFESMPWGMLKLCIYADLANGKTYKIYEYNFEIVEVCPVTVNITSIAGDDNSDHFHNYGFAHSFAGEITSTDAIRTIWSEVVYRGGEESGQAYDCSNAVLNFPEGTYSVSIRRTDLDMNLKFGSMPCGLLRLYLYAELMDGRRYVIYDYDFEIIRRCSSISINCSDRMLKQGDGFWITPTVTPSNATYINSFYFESSDPQIVSVDNYGYVQAHHSSGTATITAYTGDRFQHTSFTITVVEELLDQPLVKDYLAWPSFYDSPGTSIVLNVEEIEGAAYYELYRSTTENGTYEYRGYSDGLGNEYFENPFTSGVVIVDTDCEEETNYYYKIRARSNAGIYSEFSKSFKAHSTTLIWPELYNEEVIIFLSNTYAIPYGIDDSTGDYFELSGDVLANHNLTNVTVLITNKWGTIVGQKSATPNADHYPLNQLRIDTRMMENGEYLGTIKATAENETIVLSRFYFTIARTVNYVTTTEQLQRDIISYVQNHNSSIFNPESEVDDYFNNMGLLDIVAMGLSDYHGIAIKWLEDKISGSKYDSYMVSKYEAQIINILNEMNHGGTLEEAEFSTDETDFIKSLNDLTKSYATVKISKLNELFLEFRNRTKINWDKLGTFLTVAEECEKLDNMFDGLEIGQDFVNLVIELFTDHKKDLNTLDTIARIYNPDGNPSFSMALDKIRLSYKTQYGSSIRMVFDSIWKELEKKAATTITKAILSSTAGSVYSLVDTTFQFLYEITGFKEAGKKRIDFVTQYTMLGTLRQAFGNTITSITDDYARGNLPTEKQIHQLQVNFQSAKYALLQLYDTMMKLDERNAGIYSSEINQVNKMTLPGIERLAETGSGSGMEGGGSR